MIPRRISRLSNKKPVENPYGFRWRSIEEERVYQTERLAYVDEYKRDFEVQEQHEADNDIPRRRTGTSSVLDFEKTSTVQQVRTNEDYTSNVDASEIRATYFQDYKTNTEMPTHQYRDSIINSINSYSVVIVEGATGCGKTTQIPCYILEDAILEKRYAAAPVIYVTQPRRIAAKSIAKRVCEEHGWTLGTLVGYQVGLDKQVGPHTILTYVTAGVLLQKLIQEKSLQNYSHIIIDEAHERDADTDLLMMIIRNLMKKEMSSMRLIIMSATMDTFKLRKYFSFPLNYGYKAELRPSVCSIGDLKHPATIQVMYYDNLKASFKSIKEPPIFDIDQPELHEAMVDAAVKTIVDIIPKLDNYSEANSSTLVFLPGLAEINQLDRLLRRYRDLDIIPLHSCLSSLAQQRVFDPPKENVRKVILATNIAESSITVRDVGFIIDSCLTKTLRKDPVTRFPTLRLHWSSKDKCTQRAGRTGRCCQGKVIRLVSLSFFKTLQEYADPELLIAPLELSVLRIKNFQMGEIKGMFALVLDPPPIDEIRTAVLELKQIGGLTATYEGKLNDLDGDLTELGHVISALPIDVHLSKLIVMAYLLDVLEDAIIIAACLSTNRSIVANNHRDKLETYKTKLRWAQGSYSDLIIALEVFKRFSELKDVEKKSPHYLENVFCKQNDFDYRKLQEVSSLNEEIKIRLNNMNIRIPDQPNRSRDICEDELMLKIAFCAAFYPNYFLNEKMDAKEIKKTLCGLDPTRTVICGGLPVNQVPLFRTQILRQFEDISTNIDYISDISRALLVFRDEKVMPDDEKTNNAIGQMGIVDEISRIQSATYLAVKKRDNRYPLCVAEYFDSASLDRLQYYNSKKSALRSLMPNKLLPGWTRIVRGRPADNRRLIEADSEEYGMIADQEYVIEIELKEQQDNADMMELKRMRDDYTPNSGRVTPTKSEIFTGEEKIIRGPYSPINLTFRSVLQKSKGFSVEIEPTSLNSVVLNADYERPRRQMLVGASVTQGRSGKVLVHDTTLMPNIRGLPTIMSLLFASYYKLLIRNSDDSVVGAVFGLGWDEEGKPIDESYEVHLGFDIELTETDLSLIKRGRELMAQVIQFISIENPGLPLAEMQQSLRGIFMTLIKSKRVPIDEVDFYRMEQTDYTLKDYNASDFTAVWQQDNQQNGSK